MLIKLYSFCFSLLVATSISAQNWTIIPFSEISDESLSLTSFYEDADGNIWAGNGSKGLVVRWDGTDWKTFDNSETGMTDNSPYVGKITQDASGKMWFCSWDGIATWENDTWVNYKTSNSDLPENRVIDVVEVDDKMWFATKKNLVSFDGTSWTTIEIPDAGWSTNGLATMGNGSFFVTMGDGTSVRRFDGENWETFSTDNSNINSNAQYHVEKVDDETFWFGGPSGRGNLYENGTWTPSAEIDGWSLYLNESITDIAVNGSEDDAWFSTTDGLFHLKDGVGIEYRPDNAPFTSSDIRTVMVTRNGIIWSATANEVFVFDPEGPSTTSEIFTNVSLDVLTNPVHETARIKIENNGSAIDPNGLITIFNLTGNPVVVQKMNADQININVGDLIPGMYIVQYSVGKKTMTTRFMKQ